jgi:hypothetical protein
MKSNELIEEELIEGEVRNKGLAPYDNAITAQCCNELLYHAPNFRCLLLPYISP